jgi:hypothetical protein
VGINGGEPAKGAGLSVDLFEIDMLDTDTCLKTTPVVPALSPRNGKSREIQDV